MNCATAYGIDLGTTNSVACIFKGGKLETLCAKSSERVYPSYVSFPSTGRPAYLVGKTAKDKMKSRPKEVIHDVKRLFGVNYDSDIVKTMKKTCSFEIENDGQGNPVVAYTQSGNKITRYPQEISSYVLGLISQDMKDFAGFDINNVIITVPAYFNAYQRHLTEDAAKIAGLNVLDIITEPEAAAFAYMDINIDDNKPRNILIYDLGGGTFDVTIMRVEGTKFEELALDGDLFLGGSDFDAIIMKEFINAYEQETGNKISERRLAKLRFACESAKIDLMKQRETEISIDDDFVWTLTSPRMDALLEDKIKQTLVVCERALKSAGLKPGDIDDIVLVGGSTRLNLVEKMVPEYFGKPVKQTVNPDECVAYGAAKYALFLLGHGNNEVKLVQVQDKKKQATTQPTAEPSVPSVPSVPSIPDIDFDNIPAGPEPVVMDYNAIPTANSNSVIESSLIPENPEIPEIPTIPSDSDATAIIGKMDAVEMKTICFGSVGIPDAKMHMNKIIRKGRQLPYEKSIEIHNTEANITEMCIPVLQGEHSHASKNTIINRINITNIQPKPVGGNTFYMFFTMDKHGSLSIRVVDNDTGNDMKIHDIRYDITDDKIDGMKRAFQDDMKKNEEYLRIADEKTKAEDMIYAILREKPQFDVELTSIRQELTQAETMDQLKFIQAKIKQYL